MPSYETLMMPQLKNAREQLILTPLYTFRSFDPRSLYTFRNAWLILKLGPPIVFCIATLTTFAG